MLKKHGRAKDYKKSIKEEQIRDGLTYKWSKDHRRVLDELKMQNWFIRSCDFPYKGTIDHKLLIYKSKCTDPLRLSNDDLQEMNNQIQKHRDQGYDIIRNWVDSSSIKDIIHIHFVKYKKNHLQSGRGKIYSFIANNLYK